MTFFALTTVSIKISVTILLSPLVLAQTYKQTSKMEAKTPALFLKIGINGLIKVNICLNKQEVATKVNFR